MALSNSSAPAGLTADDIIARMLEHNRFRNEHLQRYSAVRTYEIRNPEGKLAAQAVVHVDYRAPDKKTFSKTSEEGSGIVRHLVFDRLIQSESETSSGREHRNSAITTANYTFTLAGEEDLGPNHCFVLEATPKRKEKYLFEGKIWVDAEDFAIAKIAGHPAKKPSFWINRADFVRQYQRIDGFWLPCRDETSVEVKMYGRRVFTVDHQQYVVNPANPLRAGTGEMGDPD
jgi:outer membrane lipoprotein-sorting protein